MSDELQALLDREEIREVRHRFAWALDHRDWELFASLFTDDVDADLGALGVQGTVSREELTAAFRGPFRRPPSAMGTQQLYGNLLVELAGDAATARSYLLGHHHVAGLAAGEDVELRAAYLDQLVRTADGWKISATAIEVFSVTGNAEILA